MSILLLIVLIVGGIIYWNHRAGGGRRPGSGPDRQGRSGGLFGGPRARVGDPRLAATILMLQLVRTGTPVTAAEKTRIMELMEEPLRISDIEGSFMKAWGFTDKDRGFSAVADDLVPLLRKKLSADECLQFCDMLGKVAAAWGEPSDLQIEAINRLRRRLTGSEAAPASPIARTLE